MKASKLIKELQQLKKNYGNLEVYVEVASGVSGDGEKNIIIQEKIHDVANSCLSPNGNGGEKIITIRGMGYWEFLQEEFKRIQDEIDRKNL